MLTKEEFITKTLEQVRWKKAHERVSAELSDHIEDQKNAFLRQNMTENEAMDKAVLEMGDPVEVGTLLDSSYRPKTDKTIILVSLIMIVLGTAISCFIDYGAFIGTPTYFAGFVIGLPIAFLLPFILDISRIYKNLFLVTSIYIIFLLWAAIFAYQTRVLVRLVTYSAFIMPPLYAVIMCRMRGKGYFGFLVSVGLLSLMSVLQFSMSGGIAFSLISYAVCMIMTLYAIFKGWFGGKIRPLAFIGIFVALMAFYLATTQHSAYFITRLERMFMPQADPQGYGWMTLRARDFISRSVMMGQGSGETVTQGMPGYHTNYALTNLIHRFGFIAAIILGIVMVVFLLIVLKMAKRQTSQLAKAVSYSVFLIFLLNTSIYFLINLGITGSISTCPTFLFGGKVSIIVNAFLIGILASTNRSGSIIYDGMPTESPLKIEKVKNKLIITFGDEE